VVRPRHASPESSKPPSPRRSVPRHAKDDAPPPPDDADSSLTATAVIPRQLDRRAARHPGGERPGEDSAATRTAELALTGPPGPGIPAVGPVMIESDSWDSDVATMVPPRAPARSQPRRSARVLVAALVLAGISGLVIIPLTLRSSSEPSGGPPAALGATTSPSTDPAEPGVSGTSATPTPTPTRKPTKTKRPQPKPKPTTSTRTTAPPTRTAFDPVTLQAEAGGNTLSGSARTQDGLVIGLGDWGGQPGQLRFNSVTVPRSGRYELTFFYTSAAVGGSSGNRTAHISVNGGGTTTFSTSRQDNCCASGRVEINLNRGGNTISFTNPGGRCPAIDRIVIAED
jgi:hypothetical protein